METAINNGICRCCASDGTCKDVKSTYHWMGEEEIYSDMLRECFDIALIPAEECEEGGICEVCITQLRNASNFKKQVLHTEKQFELRLRSKVFKSDIVKIEPSKIEDDGNDSDNYLSEDLTTEFEVPIKIESEEVKPKKRAAAAKASTSRAKKAKADDGEPSTKRLCREIYIKIEPADETVSNTSTPRKRAKRSSITKAKKNTDWSITITKQKGSKRRSKRTLPLNTQSEEKEITKHLNNIRMILLHTNATPIKCHTDSGYTCCFCPKQFPDPADLKRHTIEKHDDSTKSHFMESYTMLAFVVKLDVTSLQCNICNENVEVLEPLLEHLSAHGKTIYTGINSHILPFKFDNDVLLCAVCQKIFDHFKTLHEHMTVHYRNYVCEICDAGFVTKRNLQSHASRHKRGELKPLKMNIKRERDGERISFKKDDLSELNKHRFNIRLLLECSNATPIRQRGGIGYMCCFCANQYPDPADLKRHTLEDHDDKVKRTFMKKDLMYAYVVKLDITALHCKLCELNIDSLEGLIDHLTNTHNKEYYTDIKNHILPYKFESEELRCVMCPNVFTRFKGLHEHMVGHYRNFMCDSCGAGFVNRRTLAVHCDIHKTGSFKCDYCHKVFDSHSKKKRHEYCIHKQMQLVSKCGYCHIRFKDARAKDKHLQQEHGVRFLPVKCNACDKSFADKSAMRIHQKRDHLLERPHECPDCDMSFFQKQSLKNHMLKHTGLRLFRCEVCHKAFGKKFTLKEHMRIHLDDRRFKCEYCGQTFVQKCSLKGHMRSKHGEILE